MDNTAGGPFGGLLNNPDLWQRLLNSFHSIGQFLSAPPATSSLGQNALRDAAQIGLTAPLGLPGAFGLTAAGEGTRPPWEQSTVQGPLRGLQAAGDLTKLAVQDPQMLQKLATSALLGGPGAFKQAFYEHPVLTPLMALPILPGGGEMGDRMGWKWSDHWNNLLKQGLSSGLDERGAMKWASEQLQRAVDRVGAREKRVQRKLTQHEVEDVIQQAMSESPAQRPTPTPTEPSWATKRWLSTITDNELNQRYFDSVRGIGTKHGLGTPNDITWELRRRGFNVPSAPPSQNAQGPTREEMLHQFEEGPVGPLPPEAQLNRRPSFEAPTREQVFADQGNQELLNSYKGHVGDVTDVIRKGQLPSGVYLKYILDAFDELTRRGVKVNLPFPRASLENMLQSRQGTQGVAPLPNVGLPSQQGYDLLRQVPLQERPQNWQQQTVAKLNAFGAGASPEWWEKGQRFVKGPKGWMLDPNSSIPPIQQSGNQTILPRPTGALARYLKINVWDPFAERMGMPDQPQTDFLKGAGRTGHQAFIGAALEDLTTMTGNPRIARFWLMRHIFQRQQEGKATPAEVVWFELQRKPPSAP